MTDVHCHLRGGDPDVRELVIGEHFLGIHPWEVEKLSESWEVEELRERLVANPRLGVGEIGLDRLKDKTISPLMREVFESQLRLGIELNRPVVLHGAKCWGQIVNTILQLQLSTPTLPPLLFHGFSRSDGLIPDIAKLGGFISVGPSVLNDHAVNYRALVKKIPDECLVLETDRTEASAAECPTIPEICAKVAELRGNTTAEIESLSDANAKRFYAF